MKILWAIVYWLSAILALAQGNPPESLLLAIPKPAGGVAPSSLLTDLVAYWNMDETSGTRSDSLGHTDLKDASSVGYASGLIGNSSLYISNSTDVLTNTTTSYVDTYGKNFTIALWYKPFTTNLGSGLCGKAISSDFNREWSIERVSGSSAMTFYINTNGTSTGWRSVVTTGAPSRGITNEWMFVVAMKNKDTLEIMIYINLTNRFTNTIASDVANGTGSLWFGRAGRALVYLDGELDEVGMWNNILTDVQLTNLFNAGAGITYPFTGVP